MAKGNDGNFFQHSLEVVLAVHLASIGVGKLHITLTHGMSPFEACQVPTPRQRRKSLNESLEFASLPPQPGESQLVSAYRLAKASLTNYPNTGELLAAKLGRRNLTGGITEIDPIKSSQLCTLWNMTGVTVANKSWRSEMIVAGIHSCPDKLSIPWLISMDPMTYSTGRFADNNKIYKEDQNQLVRSLQQFAASNQPGVFVLFVYAVRSKIRIEFWDFASTIATNTGMVLETAWLNHQGGNRNLAAVLTHKAKLPRNWLPPEVNAGLG